MVRVFVSGGGRAVGSERVIFFLDMRLEHVAMVCEGRVRSRGYTWTVVLVFVTRRYDQMPP